MLLQGTLGGDLDIFAASGESTAWVLLWTTSSRPIGVRVLSRSPIRVFQPPHLVCVNGCILEERFGTSVSTYFT